MQQYVAVGRLTKDPKLTYTDKAKCTFFLAVEERKGSFNRVDYIPCVAWRELGELIANYTQKGKLVSVKGSLRSHQYEENGKSKMRYELEVHECDFY
ncbi:MAG: single-stranded DNA-binding protein [Psychrobacillus sp.]